METPSLESAGWLSASVLAGALAVDTGVAVAAASGSHLIGGWVWPLGVLLLFLGLVALVPGLRGLASSTPDRTRSALIVLCVAVFWAKWWWSGGLSPALVPASFTLGVTLILGLERRGRIVPSSWLFWWGLLIVLLVVSTRPLRILHRVDGVSLPLQAGILVLLAGLPPLFRLGARVLDEAGVRAGPYTLTVAACLLLLAGVGWWLRGETPPDAPAFEGTVPTVRDDVESGELPNIILISLDTLQWDPVPPASRRGLSLPALRGLFRDSIAFPHAVSTSSWTLPAHASLMTGKLPLDHGAVIEHNSRIFADVPLYTHVLRRLGYTNVGFTDGVLVGRKFGFARGFDRYWEHPVPVDYFLPGAVEWASLALRPTPWGPDVRWRDRRAAGRSDLPYPHDFRENLSRARRWIQRRDPEDERPFFMFLHTYEIHDWGHYFPGAVRRLRRNHPALYDALKESDDADNRPELEDEVALRRFRERRRVLSPKHRESLRRRINALGDTRSHAIRLELGEVHPEFFRRFLTMPRRQIRQLAEMSLAEIRQLSRIDPRELRAGRKLYDDGIERVDRSLADFLDFLRDRSLYRQSIVVLTSDHGEGFLLDSNAMGHGRGQLNEILLRVPLWIKLPGNKNAGSRHEGLVQFTDVFPMLLEHLGARPDPSLTNDPATPRRALVDPSVPGRSLVAGSIKSTRGRRPRFFVRLKRHKKTRDFGHDRTRFYRVGHDRVQQTKIPRSEVPRDVRKQLDQRMERLVERFKEGPNPYRLDNFTMDDTLRRRLRGMGYLD